MLKDRNAIDVYADGICKDISRGLKKRGIKVKSKEGEVKKAQGMGWEVHFPEGTAKVDYNIKNREWFVRKWGQKG